MHYEKQGNRSKCTHLQCEIIQLVHIIQALLVECVCIGTKVKAIQPAGNKDWRMKMNWMKEQEISLRRPWECLRLDCWVLLRGRYVTHFIAGLRNIHHVNLGVQCIVHLVHTGRWQRSCGFRSVPQGGATILASSWLATVWQRGSIERSLRLLDWSPRREEAGEATDAGAADVRQAVTQSQIGRNGNQGGPAERQWIRYDCE